MGASKSSLVKEHIKCLEQTVLFMSEQDVPQASIHDYIFKSSSSTNVVPARAVTTISVGS